MARWVFAVCVSIVNAEQVASSARQQTLENAWTDLLQPATKAKAYVSPIKRVTNLLSKMKAELEAEADKEAEMYDKMVCWCETNEKEKTKAIADAEALDKELTAEIGERAAKFGEDSTEIARLKSQISEFSILLSANAKWLLLHFLPRRCARRMCASVCASPLSRTPISAHSIWPAPSQCLVA